MVVVVVVEVVVVVVVVVLVVMIFGLCIDIHDRRLKQKHSKSILPMTII